MATWVTHFRIAEALMKAGVPVSKVDFLVGNIGPDCGIVDEEGSLAPFRHVPKSVTHFKDGQGIQPELFREQYALKDVELTSGAGSYYWGYYCHLITDVEWIKLTKSKQEETVHQAIKGTPNYNQLVKRDWYWLDFKYLKLHGNHVFWTDVQHIQQYPEYLPFFPKGQTYKQIQNIIHFYCNTEVPIEYEPVYMKEAEVDEFVLETVDKIRDMMGL
ncbi:hypothetical protein [Paenibacillus sp. FSL M7-0420]|uniref:hypothetical protein n=1 Tax=Paenibacillus sp. FSL M7-0420 TaxID=2921609 RepID=UPI0030F9EB75